MNVARFASRNARAILLGVVLLTAAGFVSMLSLPSSIYPEVEFPRIVIVAKAGDLSPRLMQLSVTRPLEEAARSVLGVRRVRSKTIRGATEISAFFNPNTDMQYALQLMQGKTDQVRGSLPADTQLQVERMTPSLFPIFMVNLTGGIPARDLRDIAEFEVRPLLSRVPDVANVEVLASSEREISVVVDPERLTAARLSIDDVARALQATNQVNSVGRLAKDYSQYLVLATAELTTLDQVRNVVVAFRQQTPVHVRDVAEVREGVTDPTLLVSGDGKPAALISVARQIHGNILNVVSGARAAMQAYSVSLPPTVKWKVVYDLAEFVKSAVYNVRDAIIIGGLLAVLVLMAFLRDWRITFIAATSLPLTLVGTFWILKIFNGTIDLMSLGGLAIAIGLVIDDAIVIVENIHRHRGMGETVTEAAENGTQELIAAVTGSTITTVVVFVPLGLLQGVVGQFFAALSLTLTSAVLLSLGYALLFIPIAAARFLRAHKEQSAHLDWLSRHYQAWLRRALKRPAIVVLVTVLFAGMGVVFYYHLETGFLPDMDEGGFVVDYYTPAGTSLAETDRMVKRVEAVLSSTPEVEGFARRTGAELGLFATPQNSGDIVVRLKPRSERTRTSQEVVDDLRATFDKQMPGMTIEFVLLLQDMLGDLEGSPEPIEVKIFGDDVPTLAGLAGTVAGKMRGIQGVVDIVTPQRGNPEIAVNVDPTRAAKAGFTVEQVSNQLASGLLGNVATSFRRGDRLIGVRVRFPDKDRFNYDWVRQFPLYSPAGTVVPLSAAATVSTVQGEDELQREDLKQMVPVTARLQGRGMSSAVADIRKMMAGVALPLGYSWELGGLYESQQESFRSLLMVMAVAILLVFGVLVAQFRRFTSALVILSAAPLSLVGAFGLLLVTGTALNVSSFMGLILLIGLIVKNGIILVDYADIMSKTEPNRIEAIVRAGSIRLRPILMTTLCTLFGLLPLALGIGAGAEMQKPLAIAVIGGLTVSTVITLVFVPALLALVDRRKAGA